MILKKQISYDTQWFRLAICLVWAVFITNLSRYDFLSTIDVILINLWTDGNPWAAPPVSKYIEWGIVMTVCLIPAIPRFERPLTMVMTGIGILFADLMTTSVLYIDSGTLLPLASPLVGVFMSVASLGSMAWSEELKRRTKMERLVNARLQFTDMLVHDLKKRISSANISLSLLEKETGDNRRNRELIDIIHASSERMLLDLNNLLDIRKIEECGMILKKQRFKLGELISESVNEHRPAAQLASVNLKIEPMDEVEVIADRHILSRVMTNLLWNAIQHAPGGSDIIIGARQDKKQIQLSVTNLGKPIPKDRQETMFTAFLSNASDDACTKMNGTGLGLAFCKLAVEAHGASICAESPWSDRAEGVKIIINIPAEQLMQSDN